MKDSKGILTHLPSKNQTLILITSFQVYLEFKSSEESRFDKDFAVHDKLAREKEYLRKLQVYEVRR